MQARFLAAWVLGLCFVCTAQPPGSRQFVGSISAFKAEAGEIEIKPDAGSAVSVKILADSIIQKIAPGDRDLKNAQTIEITSVSLGDRVLVALVPGTKDLQRLVVMPVAAITNKNEADRQDWIKRGVSGVVADKTAGQLTIRTRSLQGEVTTTIAISDKTTFKRYAPDSVVFADARPSSLTEIKVGDQLRARGVKNESGSDIAAEDVVFGTFLTRGGVISAVDTAAGTIRIKEIGTNKPLTVRVTANSRLKQMPAFAGNSRPPDAIPPGGPPPAMTAGFGARRGGPPDLGQLIESMPAARLEDLKPGGTIIVSSTKGASSDSLTAIMLVANAEPLIQMAAQPSGRQGNAGRGQTIDGGVSGLGLGGLQLSGMIP